MRSVFRLTKFFIVFTIVIALVTLDLTCYTSGKGVESVSSNSLLKAIGNLDISKNQKLVLNEYGAKINNNEIFLFFKNLDDDLVKQDLALLNLSLVDIFADDGMVLARKEPKTTLKWINDKASKIDNIVAMMPNYQRVKLSDLDKKTRDVGLSNMNLLSTVNDPLFNSQWYLSKENGINVQEAWKTTMGSPKIKVGVIDSGAAIESKEFEGRIVKQYDNTNGDNDASDDSSFSHGSHVSGIIAANSNNNYGISGIAPYVSLIEIDCFEYNEEEDEEIASDASIFRAFDICIDQGVRIVNMSFGAFSRELGVMEKLLYTEKLENLWDSGVIPVSAAGNESSSDECIPADLPTVVGVMALDETMNRTSFSNYGITKDICAPGCNIVSVANLKFFQKSDGTSMAAPMVSGVLALLASRAPYVSNEELLEIIYTTAIDLGDKGKDEHYANGLINAGAAMDELNKRYPVELTSYNDGNLVLGKTKTFSLKLHGETCMSIDVVDVVTGETVNNLLERKIYEPDVYTIAWDGKDFNGENVSNGAYRVNINVFSNDEENSEDNNEENNNLSLKHSVFFSFNVTDKDFYSELPMANIKIMNNMCFLNGIDNLKFTVRPFKDALCDITILDSNNDVIASIAKDIIIDSKEGKTFNWNLHNKYGELVSQGLYNVAVVLKNEYAEKAYKMNFTTVDVRKPKISKIKSSIINRRSNKKIKIKCQLNTQAKVRVKIFKKNKKRIICTQDKVYDAGRIRPTTELKRGKKLLKSGTYYFRIIATNNKGVVKSKYIKFYLKKLNMKKKKR